MKITLLAFLSVVASQATLLAHERDLPSRSVDPTDNTTIDELYTADTSDTSLVSRSEDPLEITPEVTFIPANKGAPAPVCNKYSTRKKNCNCRGGLMNPKGYKPKKGEQPKDNCICGDKKSTFTYKNEKDHTLCACQGQYQYYDWEDYVCRCIDTNKYNEVRVNDKLTCKLKTPKPTHKPGKPKARELAAALEQRRLEKKSRAAEEILGCQTNEKACNVYSQWVCIDIMSTLSTCGGCVEEATDCGSLPGVNEVRCDAGQCQVDSCARGYELTQSPDGKNQCSLIFTQMAANIGGFAGGFRS